MRDCNSFQMEASFVLITKLVALVINVVYVVVCFQNQHT